MRHDRRETNSCYNFKKIDAQLACLSFGGGIVMRYSRKISTPFVLYTLWLY